MPFIKSALGAIRLKRFCCSYIRPLVLHIFAVSSSGRHPDLSLFVPVKTCTDTYILVVDGCTSRKVLFNSALFFCFLLLFFLIVLQKLRLPLPPPHLYLFAPIFLSLSLLNPCISKVRFLPSPSFRMHGILVLTPKLHPNW